MYSTDPRIFQEMVRQTRATKTKLQRKLVRTIENLEKASAQMKEKCNRSDLSEPQNAQVDEIMSVMRSNTSFWAEKLTAHMIEAFKVFLTLKI